MNDIPTPEWAAADMVKHFKPKGLILDPCKGDGAIWRYLPDNAEWCEIKHGRDFFKWTHHMDWVIGNPPFDAQHFNAWLEHAMFLAVNVVYLIPPNLFFRASSRIDICRRDGWIKHVRFYGPGTVLNFPQGNPIAAMHFVRGYEGSTSWSFYWEDAQI